MYDSFFVLNHILINPNIYIIIMTFIKWPILLYNSLHIPFWMTVWANHPQLKMVKNMFLWFGLCMGQNLLYENTFCNQL